MIINKGKCTAHIYMTHRFGGNGDFTPLLFDDVNQKPRFRRSRNEEVMNGAMWYRGPNNEYLIHQPHWRSAQFYVKDSVEGGSAIWFGGYGDPFTPRFDYGGILYKNWPEVFWVTETEEYYYEDEEVWYETEGEFYYLPDFPVDGHERVYNFIYSWYFDYESQQKNYVRTITQGVGLTDRRRCAGNYRRSVTETAGVKTVLGKLGLFCRKCFETANAVTHISRFPVFVRNCVMSVYVSTQLIRWRSFLRIITEQIQAVLNKTERRSIFRTCADAVQASTTSVKTFLTHFRNIRDGLRTVDTQAVTMVYMRSVPDTARVKDISSHLGAFFRGLSVAAGSFAETAHGAEYFRLNSDAVNAGGEVSRGLLFFVRIVTRLFVRDYLVGRFLKARKDLVLKSKIIREIEFDSRIV